MFHYPVSKILTFSFLLFALILISGCIHAEIGNM